MGVLGEMFPSRKLKSEADEAGSGQGWRLGPIDLDSGVVQVHRAEPEPEDDSRTVEDPPSPTPTDGTAVGQVRTEGSSTPT